MSVQEPVAVPPRVPVTRADLAAAYLRFEKTLDRYPLPTARAEEINREFDNLTLAFFAGNGRAALQSLNALTQSLLPREERTDSMRFAASLKVRMLPPVARPGQIPIAACESIYPADIEPDREIALTLRLKHRGSGNVLEAPKKILGTQRVAIAQAIPVVASRNDLGGGCYDVVLVLQNEEEYPVAQLVVLDESLDQVRRRNEMRLAEVRAESPEIMLALGCCAGRNALLTDQPGEEVSALLLADPCKLQNEVGSEIEALLSGANPYRRRTGDTWRVLRADGSPIPVRVYAPPDAAHDKPLPLVIALHGAGGDENMFFDGYGAGRIKSLADERRFLVAAPLTYPFLARPAFFRILLDWLAEDYCVDRSRIYVLGHSLGAGAAASVANTHKPLVAATCCLAGGMFTTGPDTPPTLVIGGEIDPLVPISSLEKRVEDARASGASVEFRRFSGYGHTLIVGKSLPEAISWLLQHRVYENQSGEIKRDVVVAPKPARAGSSLENKAYP